jgi:hypothetical protein
MLACPLGEALVVGHEGVQVAGLGETHKKV